ncbi:hypothetical protein HYH02_011241 [Chlamydomonas schloesseri]|uniref:F-box domain-containing protein n=1 Tax=Chlamydomonas schloesseri TaxID=2026947 RepID=A0A835TG16_9CHLO|nr:hypothetical protein HYH02_011241 [Chlamydomonas schloesseri]|eukprot:KAG2437601.1 hypothetical protein HYH02_011241 [Chlamydomonas schloesseri]
MVLVASGHRPWLSLYNNLVTVPSKELSELEEAELAPIQRALPNEMLVKIFSKLDPYSLGRAALVCRQFRSLHEHPRLWEHACYDAFHLAISDKRELHKLMATQYRFSWRRMFIHHPHLRFDGLYVARNTYVKTGVVEFTNHRPVHLVSYYRYFRFLPDGTFLYRTSPQILKLVAKAMVAPPPGLTAAKLQQQQQPGGGKERPGGGAVDKGPVLVGRYTVRGAKVHCALIYPNSTSTELRSRLAIRSTHPGACNRLDIEAITTYDRELGSESSLVPPPPSQPDDPDPAAAKAHSRGLAPCMFVTWEEVPSHPINLPPTQMDYMLV